MDILLTDIGYWHWLVFGAILIIIEIFAFSTFFLWMGISSIIVGILLSFNPTMSGNTQLLIFAVLSISSIYISKKFFKVKTTDTQLNERASRHIGSIYIVAELTNDGAKVKVDDSLWLAKGCEMSVGKKVKVVSVDSTTLIVEDV